MFRFLLVVIFFIPFFPALSPFPGIDLASLRLIILGLFIFWLAKGLKNKAIYTGNKIQSWLIGSFLFLNLISIFASKNVDWSIRKLVFLFSIFPVYFVVSDFAKNEKQLIKIIKSAVFGGALAGIVGIAQFLMQFLIGIDGVYKLWANHIISPFLGEAFSEAILKNSSWLVNISGQTYLRATSIFPDPHMFAFYLGILLPLALFLLFFEKEKKLLFGIAVLIIFIADMLTFSRGGYLGLFGGLIAGLIIFWKNIQPKFKYALIGLIFITILAAMSFPLFNARIASIFDLREGSNQGRIVMWKKAFNVTQDKFLAGTGIGNYPLEVKASALYREPIYAHNTYLDIAVETGILNALVWISLILTAGLGFLKKAGKNNIFFFLFISVIIFSTHSFVETGIYSPTVLSLFLIIVAMNNFQPQKNESKNIQ